MAHKALIGGTAYEISGGKTLIDGTAYSIKNGKALVGGAVYDIEFAKFTPVFDMGTLTFTYQSFMKYYKASMSSDTPIVDLTPVNAIMINGVITPLPYSYETSGSSVYKGNYPDPIMPSEDYEIVVYHTIETSTGKYHLAVTATQIDSPSEVVLGTI